MSECSQVSWSVNSMSFKTRQINNLQAIIDEQEENKKLTEFIQSHVD